MFDVGRKIFREGIDMKRLNRYVFTARTFVRGGGYKRAEFLKKKNILSVKVITFIYNHGTLGQNLR